MLLGPCYRCGRENSLTERDDDNYPICEVCYIKYYSKKAKRDKMIDRLLIEKSWWQFWK